MAVTDSPGDRNERRRKSDLFDKWAPRAAKAYVLLLSVFVVAVFVQGERTSELSTRLHDATVGACHRLNVQRAETNRSNFVSWEFYRLVIHLTATSRNRARAQAHAFARQLSGYAHQVQWTPLTDCSQAVDRPLGYRPSPALSFRLVRGRVPADIARAFHAEPNG